MLLCLSPDLIPAKRSLVGDEVIKASVLERVTLSLNGLMTLVGLYSLSRFFIPEDLALGVLADLGLL